MGRHTYDQSPAMMAYDEAKSRIGQCLTGSIPAPWMLDRTEAALVEEFGQHPLQARQTASLALGSIIDQLLLEQESDTIQED